MKCKKNNAPTMYFLRHSLEPKECVTSVADEAKKKDQNKLL